MDLLTAAEEERDKFLREHPKHIKYQEKLNMLFSKQNETKNMVQIVDTNLSFRTDNQTPPNLGEYSLNKEAFQTFKSMLDSEQKSAVNSVYDQTKGQIIHATGTGKTFIQKYLHIDDMIQKSEKNETGGIYVIAAHQLLLCDQLFDKIIELSIDCGIRANYLYIGSQKYDFMKWYKKIGLRDFNPKTKTTTSSSQILEFGRETKNSIDKRHLLISSTYDSFNRLLSLAKEFKIDICTFDEAHTTVSRKFHNNIDEVHDLINKKFFFTATKKAIDENGGQNDKKFYGEVLSELSARKAIDKHKIVSPRIHWIYFKDIAISDKQNNELKVLETTIWEAFKAHEKMIKQESSNPDKIGAKMLVTMPGLDDIKNILSISTFVDKCIKNNIKIFSFSSKDKYHYIKHGKLINCTTKREISNQMSRKYLKDTDDAVLFHYNILSQGIDVPTLTGLLLLRELEKIALVQNAGRTCRLLEEDRKLLNHISNSVQNIEHMIKPFSWIILPEYKIIDLKRTEDIIYELRDKDKIIEEFISITEISTSQKDDQISPLTKKQIKIGKEKELLHKFENLKNQVYESIYIKEIDEKLADLKSNKEKGEYLLKLLE